MKFDHFDLLQQMVRERFVSMQQHSTEKFWIYNYTAAAQYSRRLGDFENELPESSGESAG